LAEIGQFTLRVGDCLVHVSVGTFHWPGLDQAPERPLKPLVVLEPSEGARGGEFLSSGKLQSLADHADCAVTTASCSGQKVSWNERVARKPCVC
jgi:hypothetical protein